jgi:lysophospholipase L1-like esterase
MRRRLATAAGYVGGALTAASALAAGLLGGQVLVARWTIPGAEAPPPRCGGRYGREFEGADPESAAAVEPIRLAVMGDSTAAGYGVHTRAETPGAMLATAIAAAARRPVQLTCPAVVGSPSAWLPVQAETVIDAGVDLAVIFIGANDVTTRERPERAVGYLAEAVRALRAAGADVVVATCPDLGVIRPILPPLRWLAGRWSRQLAHAQRAAVERAGARSVSLGDLLGAAFAKDPKTMFGPDRYHPSAVGYRAAVDVVLPAAFAALDLTSTDTPEAPATSSATAEAILVPQLPGTPTPATGTSAAPAS